MGAFASADPETYKIFSTDTSLRMTASGDPVPRDQWLNTIAQRQKGPLAVVNLRGHDANSTRQSWVYLRDGGRWKLHVQFTTTIRSGDTTAPLRVRP